MTNTPQPFTYLKDYSHFTSVPEMDLHVKTHLQIHELKQSAREVLHAIAGHALTFVGAAHLKAETIAEEIGMSVKSVYRAVKELAEFGIVAKENKSKKNGIKGANIYSIQPCPNVDVQSNVPSEEEKMSYRAEAEKLCERKLEQPKNKTVSLSSFSTNKSFKDTNITEQAHSEKQASKESVLKDALLAKLPKALNGLQLFFDRSQDIYDLAGVIFRSKLKDVQIEQHERLFRKTIKSVYEYWQRQIRNGKSDYNVFGLMTKAIRELCEKIVAGTTYKQENVPAPKLNNVPEWLPVDNTAFNSRELVPDWMENRNEEVTSAPVVDDFEAMRAAAQARIAALSK